ncbi:hypothetical protein [Ancylobacter mangrovi]|nr:hypothetical protein [Ancylobacter mangrovi]MCS0502387.1 hypothetical protein [Ancylobacter mangrovi]
MPETVIIEGAVAMRAGRAAAGAGFGAVVARVAGRAGRGLDAAPAYAHG